MVKRAIFDLNIVDFDKRRDYFNLEQFVLED